GPMARTTLDRHFRHELDGGMALLHFEVIQKFRQAIARGEAWSLQMALRNLPRFRWDRYDSKGMPFLADGEGKAIHIKFGMPSNKPEQPPIDVAPPGSGGREQPITEVPRIEAPRPRFRTEAGVYEMPRDTPSAFAQPNPRGWMK